jgi:hypothetical protein
VGGGGAGLRLGGASLGRAVKGLKMREPRAGTKGLVLEEGDNGGEEPDIDGHLALTRCGSPGTTRKSTTQA